MTFDYLIEGVSAKEYEILSKMKTEIVGSVMNSFNDIWQKKIVNVRASFTYNAKEGAIGITLNKSGTDLLALERERLSEEEDAVVASLYSDLHKELKNIRLKKGPWT